eukprot:6199356-Pleurochrysis_carterae.AAC.5
MTEKHAKGRKNTHDSLRAGVGRRTPSNTLPADQGRHSNKHRAAPSTRGVCMQRPRVCASKVAPTSPSKSGDEVEQGGRFRQPRRQRRRVHGAHVHALRRQVERVVVQQHAHVRHGGVVRARRRSDPPVDQIARTAIENGSRVLVADPARELKR